MNSSPTLPCNSSAPKAAHGDTVLCSLPPNFPRRLQDLPPQEARFCLSVERFMREEMGWGAQKTSTEAQKIGVIGATDETGATRLANATGAETNSANTAWQAAPNAQNPQFPHHSPVAPTILVACSGGRDSVALALILHYLAPRLGVRLGLVHLDHALRPESSDDAAFVTEFAQHFNLPLISERRNISEFSREQQCGEEEAGRLARYELFARARAQFSAPQANDHSIANSHSKPNYALYAPPQGTQCDMPCDAKCPLPNCPKASANAPAVFIATAHHLDDLQEDILMRLVRGTGWPALGGMKARDDTRGILRPLLLQERARITQFLQTLHCPWREDATNNELFTLRNRMRHSIVPLLQAENPALSQSIAHVWKLARIDEKHWNEALSSNNIQPNVSQQSENTEQILLSCKLLRTLSKAARLRLYKQTLDALGEGQASLPTLFALDTAWKNSQCGKIFQFSGGKLAEITRKNIVFFFTIDR